MNKNEKSIKQIDKSETYYKALDAFNIYCDRVFEEYNFVDISVRFDNTGMIVTNEILPKVFINFGMTYTCVNVKYETPKTLANRLFSDLENTLEDLSFKTFIK